MKRRYMIFAFLAVVILLILAFGKRPTIDGTVTFDPARIGPSVESYLAESEEAVSDIRPGTEKEIVWAHPDKRRTSRALVYLHGFSATKMETRPLADLVAETLGANLFYSRLTGHGRDSEAMLDASMNDWVNDAAEAIAIGEKIGERVVLIGTSTGGTLATWVASQPRLAARVAAIVLISPNYSVRGASTGMLNMPWGEYLLPLAMGETRSFEPHNEEHAKWWTTSYPSRSVFAMGALLKATADLQFEDINVPAMFIYSPNDKVIVPRAVENVFERWGAQKRSMRVTDSGDPSSHVIAGDILSPSTTEPIASAISAWLQSLE